MTEAEVEAEVGAIRLRITSTLLNLGSSIDKLVALREEKRTLDEAVKKVETEVEIVQTHLMEQMAAQGMDKASSKLATASISKIVVGNVTDWDAFNKYVKKTGYFHLYQRRLSDAAVRELFESKGSIPGVEPFTKSRLNLRAL